MFNEIDKYISEHNSKNENYQCLCYLSEDSHNTCKKLNYITPSFNSKCCKDCDDPIMYYNNKTHTKYAFIKYNIG